MQIILAPMQGLTEVLFRRVYENCFPGIMDHAISPFLSLANGELKHADKKVKDVLPEENIGSIPLVPQILGKEPEAFINLANYLFDLGYEEVNWNIGCPVRRVTAKHRGSGILPYPTEIEAILSNIIPRLKGALSVKMRLGLTNSNDIYSIIPILNRYPIKNVTIHPRTGQQAYSGIVDLDTFAKVIPLLKCEVIYNGDIVTLQDYNYISRRFPQITKFMIGRGILQNPPLACRIKQSSLEHSTSAADDTATVHGMHDPFQRKDEEIYVTHTRDLMLQLLDAIDEHLPSAEAKARKTKEYWCLMFKAFHVSEEKKNQVLHCSTFSETRRAIEKAIQ